MPQHDRIAVIQGSIREGRMNDRVTKWVLAQLTLQGFDLSVIDPRDPSLLPLQVGEARAVDHLRALLAPAHGFVIVTPEYNHAAPGPLKTLIDSIKAEWQARPDGFVSYGGISGGLRAVEALRPVFAELHVTTLRETVSFAAPWNRFDENGFLIDPEDHATAEAAMSRLGQQLRWWSEALATARAARPYEKAVA